MGGYSAVLFWLLLGPQSPVLSPALSAALPAKEVPRIDFEEFRLDNRLRVILSRETSVPVAALAMIFDVGGRHEARGRSGFAHLFEHMMFEGSRNAPKGVFDRLLERYGADNNASTHKDFTFYYEELPSNAVPIAIWLDADRVGALEVTAEAVKNQIEVVKEEKRMRVDNAPYGHLLDVAIPSRTFSNWQNAHPVIGSFEDLDAANLADVQAFFDAYYAPRNAIIAVVGDIDRTRVRAWLGDYFGWIPNRRESPRPPDASEPPSGPGKTVRLRDAHANLPALAMAWKGMPERGSPDYYALTLLGRALFSGKSSRLYQILVKEAQVAVLADGGLGVPVSDWSDYKAPGLFGGFVVHRADVPPEQVRRLVFKALAEVAESGLGERELARVKTKFRSDWLLSQQTALGRAERLLIAALLDGDPAAANGLDRYLAPTSEDIRRVAKAYLGREVATLFEVSAGGKK